MKGALSVNTNEPVFKLADYWTGIRTGWTWMDFSGSIPAETGRWFISPRAAQRDWDKTGPRRTLPDGRVVAGCVILQRNQVATFLDAWTERDGRPVVVAEKLPDQVRRVIVRGATP